MQSAVDRILPVYEKMLYDSTNRMNQTLQIFRACRLFNYEFVASTNALALGNEWHQFNKVPKALPMLLNLMDEVDLYKRLATAEFSKAKDSRLSL